MNNKFMLLLAALLAVFILSCNNSAPGPGEEKKPYTPPVFESVSFTGDGFVSSVLRVEIEGTGLYPVWIFNNLPDFSTSGLYVYSVKEDDLGKTIKAGAYGLLENGNPDQFGVSDEETGPVIRGWRVTTIATYLPHETNPGNRDQRFQVTGDPKRYDIVMDEDGFLYIGINVAYVGWRILKIDPNEYDETHQQVKVSSFGWEGSGGINGASIQGLAVGPDKTVYASLLWGKDRSDGSYILGYNQAGNTASWGSGNIAQALTSAGKPGYDPANWNYLGSLAVDANNNIYMTYRCTDAAVSIIKVTQGKSVSVLAGGPKRTDESVSAGRFSEPSGMAVGPDGSIYVADGYHDGLIKKVNIATGEVAKFAGEAYNSPFVAMGGLTYGRDNNFYVIDRAGGDPDWGAVICKIDPDTKKITRIAGDPGCKDYVDGPAGGGYAKFRRPYGLAVDANGSIYVMDELSQTNAALRKIWFDDTIY